MSGGGEPRRRRWSRLVLEPLPRGTALVGLFVFGVGWASPLARPGYELGLVTGLVAPSIVAVHAALDARARAEAPFEALRRSLAFGALAALAALVPAVLHGARAGFCDPLEGGLLFALGPLAGLVLASAWGLVASWLVERLLGRGAGRSRFVVGALLGPIGSLLVGLAAFHATPMVFAYDPFVGFFSGSLYDTILSTEGLRSYRLASLATLVSLGVLAVHLERRDGVLSLAWRSRPGLTALGVATAVASATSVAYGPVSGHWHTAGTIERALGASTVGALCRVVHEPGLREEARLLARECDAHARELAAELGIERPASVVAFLFQSAEQRRFYTGAHHTSIAKPWRSEIYLESEGFPHPVLRHELAHALGASLARGPFRVAGRLGGWFPDPGLIEGFAEWLAPRDDELSGDEWAAAMRRLGILPRLDGLFGIGFLLGGSSASYTTAGSFVRHVRERFGVDAVRRWYGGETLEVATGASLDTLERSWWERLDAVALGENVLREARLRFERPGVLGRRCPHAVDRMLAEATPREASDPEQALTLYRAVLALDPGSARALFGVPACEDRAGRVEVAVERLVELTSHAALPEAARTTAVERLGDLALRAGRHDEAVARYREVESRVLAEDRLRTLELKARYAGDPLGRGALLALLIGDGVDAPNPIEAMDRIGAWHAARPEDGVPSYLLGRQLVHARRFRAASVRLDEALARPLPARVEAEALRLRIRTALVDSNCEQAGLAARRHEGLAVVAPARKAWWSSFVRRACGSSSVAHRPGSAG
ncbi:MAG: hypothetical protein FJ096_09690 [Deltaproteobacteria bacterium]|nr:hypothetical protein [Deltaproteobacteria bacterium]